MQVIGKKRTQQARLTIRVSKNTLSFSVVDREAEHQLIYEPYTVKSGVSIAANLRQAFVTITLLLFDDDEWAIITELKGKSI